MKRVLFVTYHFPPSGGAKTRRTLKFLKYLARGSWTPVVLTVAGAKLFNFDPSLLQEIPQETHVHRVAILPMGRAKAGRQQLQLPAASGHGFWKKLQNHLKRVLQIWVAIPDEFIVWAPAAVLRGIRLITREHIDIIYSTAPPFSNHLIAAIIARLTKKPLVSDFRDAWVSNPIRTWECATKMRRTIEALLEKSVIQTSDAVISTTEGITHDFRFRYPSQVQEKFVTITNGYDREEFSYGESHHHKSSRKMRIVHTGLLRMERSPKPFLKALRLFINDKPEIENEIEVYLIGESRNFLDGKNLTDYIKEYDLERVVKETGHISRVEATRYQMEADILLLIIGVVPREQVFTYGIASKVFDYMLTQKPILVLADEGPVRSLVEETKIGVAIYSEDILGIKHFLDDSLRKFRLGTLQVETNIEKISRYDMKDLTEKLSTLLEYCITMKKQINKHMIKC